LSQVCEKVGLMILEGLLALSLLCSVWPAALFLVNLRRYWPPRFGSASGARMAVLIPARDEELNIAACLECVLASHEAALEVLVLDDDSADRTVQVALDIAARDARVRVFHSGDLPHGWNGKQYACWQLAQHTDAELLVFLDADVRLQPWALARCQAELRAQDVALVSGFPRQVTVGAMEWLLLPLIHFVLLGFLPMGRMRKTTDPATAAGCGQFMMVKRDAYFASGGHAAIRETRHDGLRLPQVFREHGYHTELVDLTNLASVRMYDSAAKVWSGLAKNATEGLAAPARIVPITLLLTLGQIVPAMLVLLLVLSVFVPRLAMVRAADVPTLDQPGMLAFLVAALLVSLLASFLPRLLAVKRFKQPMKSALLQPVGVALLLIVQWYALVRQMVGSPVGWRTRRYSSQTGGEI
jgi:hypothetical protein